MLGVNESAELLGGVAARDGPLRQQFFLDGRVVEGLGHFLLDAQHHVRRRACGRHQTKPGARFIALHRARLLDGGHVGQGSRALGAGHTKRPEFAGLDLRQGGRQVVKHHIHIAAHQVQHGGAGAAVGDVWHEGAGHGLEQLAGQVDGRAVAGRRHAQLGWVCLGVADEVRDVLDAQCVCLLGVHDHHIGHLGHQRDGGEVFFRVIGHLGVQRLVDAVGAHGAHQQGVAVGGGFGHQIRANVAARAGAVFDDEGLAKGLGQLRRHGASQDVGGATGCERHHDLHRLGWPDPLGQRGGCY